MADEGDGTTKENNTDSYIDSDTSNYMGEPPSKEEGTKEVGSQELAVTLTAGDLDELVSKKLAEAMAKHSPLESTTPAPVDSAVGAASLDGLGAEQMLARGYR